MRGVYIHIPFCKNICSYCDFCKFLYNEEWANTYLDFLNQEIQEYYEGDKVKSIYIGGGTPSSLSTSNLNKLFEIISHIRRIEDAEITFECNINDITEELLIILKGNNVNRLSIGVESFNKRNLKLMNRSHTKKEVFEKINLCKRLGFNNINVDLIYALPEESLFTLKSDLNTMLKLGITHVSTYSLIIEEHTMLYNNGTKSIDELLDYKMYKYICKKLKKRGFGLGAHGYINEMRYENTRNFNKYLKGKYRLNELLVSTQEEMENEVILGLRKLDGISISEFNNRFKKDIFDVFKLDEAIKRKYLIMNGDKIYIPEDKIYVMNEIINMIL